MRAVNLEKLLPADIPQGERVLWHGRPNWMSLARRAFRADFVAAYFVALTAWSLVSIGYDAGFAAGALAAAKTALGGVAAIALLGFLAWLSSRTTLYVVTTRRLVMKIGIALPIFFNLPFSQIRSASLRVYPDGTGDIPVALGDGQRIAYLQLWPHARPLRFAKPEPTLRCVPRAAEIAEALSRALSAESAPEPVMVRAQNNEGGRAAEAAAA